MRSGRRDEDVEREVAVELLERGQRVGAQRRLLASRLDDSTDEGAELVAPRQPVVADARVVSVGPDRDGGEARETLRLLLHPAGHTVAELRQPFAHTHHLRPEIDVARPRPRRLLRTERHEELNRPRQRAEPLAHLRLLLGAKDGHTGEPNRVGHRHGSAPPRPSDLLISLFGIGTAPIGSRPGEWWVNWGPQEDADSVRAIQAAVDGGVNWVDTAPFYGWGHAEEVVGRALAGREDVLVFTKCGTLRGDDGGDFMDLSPQSIRRGCDQSLRRLGREQLDLLQFHDPDRNVPIEESDRKS